MKVVNDPKVVEAQTPTPESTPATPEVVAAEVPVVKVKKGNKGLAIAIIVAIVVIMGAIYYYFFAPSNYFIIDVNPSIKIEVNRLNQVTSVTAVNTDAETLLSGYTITYTNLEVVIGEIVDRMILNGYVTADQSNNIMVTTDSDTVSVDLSSQVNAAITTYLTAKGLTANQLQITVTATEQEMNQMEEEGHSAGKEAIINQILAVNTTLNKDSLENMSIAELMTLAQQNNVSLNVNYYHKEETNNTNNDNQDEDNNANEVNNNNDDNNEDEGNNTNDNSPNDDTNSNETNNTEQNNETNETNNTNQEQNGTNDNNENENNNQTNNQEQEDTEKNDINE